MNEKTFSLLEFHKIRDAAADCALSGEAAELLKKMPPHADAENTRREKSLVSFILDRINSGDGEPAGLLPEIARFLPKPGVEGASLEMDEAFALGIFIERGEALKAWLETDTARGEGGAPPCAPALRASAAPPTGGGPPVTPPLLPLNQPGGNSFSAADILARIPDCSPAAREIFKVLDREGKLRDLPELRDIRRRIRNLGAERDALVARYTGAEETRRMLQSDLPSQRDGRAVLAVKANFRGRIRGIVHEVSGTGQTLFIEPEDVVEKNNDILLENRRLEAEIRRIFRELTAKIAEHSAALREFHEKIITLETFRARAKYSKQLRGHFAEEGENIVLLGARHPLLGRNAIPIGLKMTARQVIITGPNTGGKTVTLKTAGLFALMNQWGLALPAEEGTALPVFGGVFADIGDEQSLSQSLSTFSAHMTGIAAIAEAAAEDSLVLLDELGSGTDPQEGSAIAMAILDFLAEKKCRVLVTTHHGALKNYGYTHSGAENASVEFDAETLSPTYRIVMGLPGESRAVEIARRNGLGAEIIAAARGYLSGEQADMSALIAELKTRRQELERETEAAAREASRLREERRRADLRELRLKQKDHEIKSGGMGLFRALLSESRKTLENLVREVREGEITREKTMKVKEFLAGLAREVESHGSALAAEESALREERRKLDAEVTQSVAQSAADHAVQNAARDETPDGPGKKRRPSGKAAAPPALAPGAAVLAGEWKRRGRVIRREKDGWLVETGSLRIVFPENELVPVEAPRGKAPQKAQIETADVSRGDARLELSLRGMRLEEALEALRRQLDQAIMAGLGEFAVVHGKGDGILQRGVHDYLKQRPEVADYWFSRPEQGGFGRTEVVLKMGNG